MAGKWIKKAIKHPGALHRALHVPQGEKIPAKKMASAAKHGTARIKQMVSLAHTLKGFHRADGGVVEQRMHGGAVAHRMDRAPRS